MFVVGFIKTYFFKASIRNYVLPYNLPQIILVTVEYSHVLDTTIRFLCEMKIEIFEVVCIEMTLNFIS